MGKHLEFFLKDVRVLRSKQDGITNDLIEKYQSEFRRDKIDIQATGTVFQCKHQAFTDKRGNLKENLLA